MSGGLEGDLYLYNLMVIFLPKRIRIMKNFSFLFFLLLHFAAVYLNILENWILEYYDLSTLDNSIEILI